MLLDNGIPFGKDSYICRQKQSKYPDYFFYALIMRIPYTQQFSPAQTPLKKLLPIMRKAKDRSSLEGAIASAFFSDKPNPLEIAKNTPLSLGKHGFLLDGKLTDLGRELVNLSRDIPAAEKFIAQNILLRLNGIQLIETLRDMRSANINISLTSLPTELRARGFEVSANSSDLSGILGWLRAASVITGQYDVNDEVYKELTNASVESIGELLNLDKPQMFFIHSMLSLNVTDWTPYNTILSHAEEIFSGEIIYNRKDPVKKVLEPLEKIGLIQIKKKEKKDKTTTAGRGGRPADVKPTPKFEKEISEALLKGLVTASGLKDIREIRSRSLEDIVTELQKSNDHNVRGRALELLAIRLCQMLNLDFMGWRTTDSELAGGGEVDALLHSDRLIYSRWQIQCKIGSISMEAVAKEVGMQQVSLSNVLLLVSADRATPAAETYRRKIVASSNLNIVFIDGQALKKIVADPSQLIVILKQQARNALTYKPKIENISVAQLPSEDAGRKSGIIHKVVHEDTPLPAPAYTTELGQMFCGDSLRVLPSLIEKGIRVKLLITSPPFALLKKKEYGNEEAEAYIAWFNQFTPLFKDILEPDGSIVIDIGGAWVKGLPVKSTYHYQLLMNLCESGLYLAQDFYHYNKSKLPTPAEWVTIRRLRVKDAVNNVWWFVKDPWVAADNRMVLNPYSDSMKDLLKNGYKPAVRPSGHDISDKFQQDNGGSIPSNLLSYANTESNSYYLRKCKEMGIKPHPARFPQVLPEFFIKFLTKPGDLVLDPFGGSNVTGAAAEALGRKWIGIELEERYVAASKFRFDKPPKPATEEDEQLILEDQVGDFDV